ncbi:DnaJ-domain-containing protein [Wilcoxina mikolae CBS 423.85]|nr:DnaJ-domain-containing protein [Wilcoxina mikolae CBS 423.85]
MPPNDSEAAAYATTSETDFYEILGVTADVVSDSTLRKAFRKQSLRWHPDKNPSPEAAGKFHLLTIAYDVISDPAARNAYDNARAARLAKKRRSEAFNMHRRQMQEDLENRESKAKRTKVETEDEEERFRAQLAKLQEEGAKLRHKREEALRTAAKEQEEQQEVPRDRDIKSPTSRFSELDRTITVRWRRKGEGERFDEGALRNLFGRFGKIQDCISKSSGKDKRYQNGLIVFESIVGAHSAVRTFIDSKDDLFKAFKTVTWAAGKEPELTKDFALPLSEPESYPSSQAQSPVKAPSTPRPAAWTPRLPSPKGGLKRVPSFASFSSAAATPKHSPFSKSEAAQSPDYESITLMRLREAEKRRLEAEMRKKDERSESIDAS